MKPNRKRTKLSKTRRNTKGTRRQAALKTVRMLKEKRQQPNLTAGPLVRAKLTGTPTDYRWPPGGIYTCPVCERKAFEGRIDLIHAETQYGLHREYHNLRGAQCKLCHVQLIDPRDWLDIQRDLHRAGPVFRAEIVRGRFGRLAIKWPQALQQVWRMKKGTRLTLTSINATTFLIRRATK